MFELPNYYKQKNTPRIYLILKRLIFIKLCVLSAL
jgi:hypothetical protein